MVVGLRSIMTAVTLPKEFSTPNQIVSNNKYKSEHLSVLGYRGSDFEPGENIDLLCVGGDLVAGIGLAEPELLTAKLRKSLFSDAGDQAKVFNAGVPGKSPDFIARFIMTSANLLSPKLVIIVFPNIGRREFFNAVGKCIDFIPGGLTGKNEGRRVGRRERDQYDHLSAINTPFYAISNFIKNYKIIDDRLTDLGIRWGYAFEQGAIEDSWLTALINYPIIDEKKFIGVAPREPQSMDNRYSAEAIDKVAKLVSEWKNGTALNTHTYSKETKPQYAEFLNRFYPKHGMPNSILVQTQQSRSWAEEAYGYINDNGYRGDPLDQRGVINVLSIGCSNGMGAGVERDLTYHQKLKFKLSEYYGVAVQNWNVAIGGTSIDYTSRMLATIVEKLKPELTLFMMTAIDRREFFDPTGRNIDYHWAKYKGVLEGKHKEPDDIVHWLSHFYALGNVYDDTANLLKNFIANEAVLERSGTMWGYTTVYVPETKVALEAIIKKGWANRDKYVGSAFECVDYVEPGVDHHPGPESHDQFSELLFNWYTAKYGERIEKLCEAQSEPLKY